MFIICCQVYRLLPTIPCSDPAPLPVRRGSGERKTGCRKSWQETPRTEEKTNPGKRLKIRRKSSLFWCASVTFCERKTLRVVIQPDFLFVRLVFHQHPDSGLHRPAYHRHCHKACAGLWPGGHQTQAWHSMFMCNWKMSAKPLWWEKPRHFRCYEVVLLGPTLVSTSSNSTNMKRTMTAQVQKQVLWCFHFTLFPFMIS